MTQRCDDLPPDLAEAIDRARPRLGRLGSTVLFFDAIGSTNDAAATLAEGGDHEGAVVIADTQTAGRGRRGHSWFSPPASGLYVSVVLAPGRARITPDRAMTLTTLTAGVALAEAVDRATGLSADIKWPNDLLIGGRKLAGILAEAVDAGHGGPDATARDDANASGTREARESHVVLGYGINVSPAAYPAELANRVTSLESELGRRVDRAMLFAETLAALAGRYGDLLEGRFDAILDAWRSRAPRSRGARVSWETADGPRAGVTAGIDDRGALLVHVGERLERIVAGEISWDPTHAASDRRR